MSINICPNQYHRPDRFYYENNSYKRATNKSQICESAQKGYSDVKEVEPWKVRCGE